MQHSLRLNRVIVLKILMSSSANGSWRLDITAHAWQLQAGERAQGTVMLSYLLRTEGADQLSAFTPPTHMHEQLG